MFKPSLQQVLLLLLCALSHNRCSTQTIINGEEKEPFEWERALTAVELCSYAYCGSESYHSQSFEGACSGFEQTAAIGGTNGFVGYHKAQSAIYIVYGGTNTESDWVLDLDIALTPYSKCKDCKVHQGFFVSQQLGFLSVLLEVEKLKMLHPFSHTIVTGHSKGAAEALLTALDLIDYGYYTVSMINFGSPRVGNANFAAYASSRLHDHQRITHHQDRVPLLPPTSEGYLHITGEWYEDPSLVLYRCAGFEDGNCSAQWHRPSASTPGLGILRFLPPVDALPSDRSVDDHLHYLGTTMRCPSSVTALAAPAPTQDAPSLDYSAMLGWGLVGVILSAAAVALAIRMRARQLSKCEGGTGECDKTNGMPEQRLMAMKFVQYESISTSETV